MLTVTEGLRLADRYVVDHKLAVGGSGVVWKAHDTVLERPVAVKVVPEGVAAARLAREARATAGIGVRNVVAVYDVGEQDGAHFLVMEFVDGVDLATLLAATGPLDDDLAVLVARDVARGVAAVHAAELVHRDVTPANVLVTVEGEVKLTDLGIARRTDAGATRRLTEVGTVVGTVDYLAPEQVEGGDVTAASDVYAAGLLLHTLRTGRAPFGDGPMSERLARRLARDPEPIGEDPYALVVRRAAQRDPGDRYADGAELGDALQPLVPQDPEPLRARLAERVRTAATADPSTLPDATAAVEAVAPVRPRPRPGPADARADEAAPEPSDRAAAADPPAAAGDGGAGRTTVVPTNGTAATAGAGAGAGAAAAARSAPAAPAAGEGLPEPGPPSSDGHEPLQGLARPIIAAVLGLVVVVGLASALLAGGDGGGAADDGDGGDAPATVTIAAVDDHDPLGGGGEHGDEIGRVADGDPATAWDTEGYEGADLGGLKSGVGFLVDLGGATEVGAVELDLGLPGVDVTVTVSDERPAGDPTADGTVLGAASGAEGTVRVAGDAPVTGRWVAVWFTSLAPDGGRFRAEVAEVRVLAP